MDDLFFRRTDSTDQDFLDLVKQLDADLEFRYGNQQRFFAQFNSLERIKHVIIAQGSNRPIGCGAFRPYDDTTCDIKRMFVVPAARGKKTGSTILAQLEEWAFNDGYRRCILETAKNQPEAIKVYKNCGYALIPNYDQYAGVDMSICMEKFLYPFTK